MTHLLDARHAFREGNSGGCNAQGTQQVSTEISSVTCPKCKHFYWHVQGIGLSQDAREYLRSRGYQI